MPTAEDTPVCGRTLVVIHMPIDMHAFTAILTALAAAYPSAVIEAPDREVVVVVAE